MKTRTMWVTVAVMAVLMLMAGGAGAIPPRLAPEATVGGKINYQGRLTNPDGTPLSGTFPMRFQVYDDPGGGTMLWDSGVINVDMENGLFNVGLAVDPTDFNGQALWLRIYVNGEWLSPRQELVPVPYALSLRPGAEIKGEPTAWEGWVLKVNMAGTYPLGKAVQGSTATGSAVYGESTGGYGLRGYSEDGYAVYGVDSGTSQARGYGGYFTSANGVGVYGYSGATRTASNDYAPGVYGRSLNGTGVYGLSEGSMAGVLGESIEGHGVYGFSHSDIGVYGYTDGTTTDDYGVYGTAGGGAYGVYGYQSSTTGGLGVYGKKEDGGSGVSGYNGGSGNGTWGYSSNYNGVGGGTGRVDNNYGLYTADNLYSLNLHMSGAVMHVAQNGDTESLERGDVVVIAGLGKSLAEGMSPMIRVRKTREANSTAVVGIVASSYAAEWLTDDAKLDPTGATGLEKTIPLAGPGPIAPGEYLLIVVQGPCEVKVGATAGTIQPGNLLSSAGQAGYAAKAAEVSIEGIKTAVPGSVFGKALEPLDKGQRLIYVFVTLQ